MPRRFVNDGQEAVFADFNGISSALERGIYDRFVHEMVQRRSNAFFQDAHLVEYATGTSVTVRAGLGIQEDLTQVSPEPTKRPLFKAIQTSHSISTPHATLPRIDILCVKALVSDEISATRKFKAPITFIISNVSMVVQKDWSTDVLIVAGTPAGSPVAPATPAGYLRIAALAVSAITGLAGSGAVTDERILLPIGGELLLNTTGKLRITAGLSVSLKQIVSDIDAYLKNGYQEFTDFDALGADPASPAAAKVRFFHRLGTFYQKDQFGVTTPIGGGAGGGGGAQWYPPSGLAPLENEENFEKVYMYESGLTQELDLYLKIPQTYIAGRPITMFIGIYSPSVVNTILMRATAYLIRKNLDAITSTTNSRITTNAALTNAVANRSREAVLDLTSVTGTINSIAVSPGDLIRVRLFRDTDTDTADLRMVPSATEVKFT